jgi:hypothetical protein
VLAGSGRSGTTWLGNILAAGPARRVVFEPFDYRKVPEAASLPLRPYARPDGHYPQWEKAARLALTGRLDNGWVNQEGRRWWAWRVLVKEIRANLMLGWIHERFHPRILLAMRHPCAVVASRLKLKWETHLDVFLDQPELVEDYLRPFLGLIHAAGSDVHAHAVMWCIENLVPLRQFAARPELKWQICTYEQLYNDPLCEAAKVLNGLGLPLNVAARRVVNQVSSVTRADSAIRRGVNPLEAWRSELTHGQITEVLAVVRAFDIRLYGDDLMPDMDELRRLGQQPD